MRDADPKGGVGPIGRGREEGGELGREPATRDRYLRQVDRAIAETQQFIAQNRPQLDLAEKNNNTRQEIDRERRTKVVVQEKVALLVNDCNRLMDEQRVRRGAGRGQAGRRLGPQESRGKAALVAGQICAALQTEAI